MKIQPKKKRKWGRWYWNLIASNGQVLATSEGYFSKSSCLRTVRSVAEDLNIPIDERYLTKWKK
jgi:uncharacterized protein YegP (UPF0339 family)